jgi:hypothetical protein
VNSPVSTSGYSLTQNGVLLLSEVVVPQVGGELVFAWVEMTLRTGVVTGFRGCVLKYTFRVLRCVAA